MNKLEFIMVVKSYYCIRSFMSNKQQTVFDYTFLGLGCGNGLLMLELDRKGLLTNKHILILEPDSKNSNDKTFCFWMEPHRLVEFGLQDLVRDEWKKVAVVNEYPQQLNTFNYYHIPALTLYEKVKSVLEKYNPHTIHEAFHGQTLANEGTFALEHGNQVFHSKFVFDNRPPSYVPSTKRETQLYQSFYGWEITTENQKFDAETFTMMDFNTPQDGATQFMYVLPFDEHRALFEITRFGEAPIEKETAESTIHQYLAEKHIDYKIVQTEQGIIRMFNAPFKDVKSASNLFHTGERGGSLKPSTGYSFVRSLHRAETIAAALIVGKQPRFQKAKRFAYYDRILLQILKSTPNSGKKVFTQLFAKNKIETVLRFLDERSNPKEELAIFRSLPLGLFAGAALKDAFWSFWSTITRAPIVVWMSLIALFIHALGGEVIVYTMLILGMLLVGIPHGALDHLYTTGHELNRNLAIHVVKYLGIGLLVLVLFWLSPAIGLIFFLLYSSWHFGETDFTHWELKNKAHAFAYGSYLLGGLLLSHLNESLLIIRQMYVNLNLDTIFSEHIGNAWIILGGLYFTLWKKNFGIIFSILTLLILQWVPLISAFAIFFIFQHSIHGWLAIKRTVKESHFNLWLKALPFTLGALFLLGTTSLFTAVTWGQIFIFLAALSFPHVLYTSLFSMKTRN